LVAPDITWLRRSQVTVWNARRRVGRRGQADSPGIPQFRAAVYRLPVKPQGHPRSRPPRHGWRVVERDYRIFCRWTTRLLEREAAEGPNRRWPNFGMGRGALAASPASGFDLIATCSRIGSRNAAQTSPPAAGSRRCPEHCCAARAWESGLHQLDMAMRRELLDLVVNPPGDIRRGVREAPTRQPTDSTASCGTMRVPTPGVSVRVLHHVSRGNGKEGAWRAASAAWARSSAGRGQARRRARVARVSSPVREVIVEGGAGLSGVSWKRRRDSCAAAWSRIESETAVRQAERPVVLSGNQRAHEQLAVRARHIS